MQAPPSTYNTGEDAITRSLDVVKENTPSSLAELESAFEIAWTASVIEERNYSRIALQFPDELLHISVPVYQAIKAKLAPTRQLYVLADTTYGRFGVIYIHFKGPDLTVDTAAAVWTKLLLNM
ncbi:hypothetical protein M407DRAFT_25339 [Tulasnella calospora MUT 4182]|uniref:Uncharacterized protein n=1 Tax=Tulasnella calospora MUT 4182 TaxID=1051891 RepID=A0A0C3KV91_9AGAM|nr:hypothetical protein M407DRAFT_25339 [Tulasnella calospora MUT 4182]